MQVVTGEQITQNLVVADPMLNHRIKTPGNKGVAHKQNGTMNSPASQLLCFSN